MELTDFSLKIFQNFFESAVILESVTIFENNSSSQTFWFEWNGEKVNNNLYIAMIIILDFLKFKFLRFSELQEMLFSYYILSHTYYLKKGQVK